MGIDYCAEYGVGYEVTELEGTYDEEDYENFVEYLDCNVEVGFSWFETGCAYSGRCDGYFITVDNPFKYGLDLTKVKEELDTEIERLKVCTSGGFSTVGGLYVY